MPIQKNSGINRRQLALVGAMSALPCTSVFADDFPNRPVRIISPFSAGATSDVLARAIAQKLNKSWDVPVIIENKPGGGSIMGADLAAKSAADGYTLLAAAAAIGVLPALHRKLPFELYRDLQPITLIGTVPFMMLVHPSLPVKTVQEFIRYTRSNPEKVNFSSGGNGTIPHMGGELLKLKADLGMTHIPFKGGADSLTALLGGQVQMTIDGGPHVINHIKNGSLRLLAVATLQRLAEFPGVATIAESGFPGFESNAWQSLWVTGGTPQARINKISQDVLAILKTAEVIEQFKKMGVVTIGSSPAEAEAFIRAETKKWGAVIQAADIREG